MSFKIKMPELKLSRKTKIWIGAGIALFLIAVISLTVWYLDFSMFKGNDHFIFKRLTVESPGWWNGKVNEMEDLVAGANDPESTRAPELALRRSNMVNIFTLDLSRIKEKIESDPVIESASVRRILPDTISIKIDERLPVVILNKKNSPYIVTSDCTVVSRYRCVQISDTLPLVTGFTSRIPDPGERFPDAAPAVNAVRAANALHPEFTIMQIHVTAEDYMILSVYYRNNPADRYSVYMKTSEPEAAMDRLNSSIIDIKRRGAPGRVIDLRFDKKTILKPNF